MFYMALPVLGRLLSRLSSVGQCVRKCCRMSTDGYESAEWSDEEKTLLINEEEKNSTPTTATTSAASRHGASTPPPPSEVPETKGRWGLPSWFSWSGSSEVVRGNVAISYSPCAVLMFTTPSHTPL